MTRQISISIRRYLRWIPFFLVLLFLFVQLMPRALGQRQLSNKSSDANGAIPSVTQASPSSPRFNCTGNRYLIDEIGSFFFESGTTDTGNHCDDCDTLISLPFPYTLYNQTFTQVYVNSNGRLDFVLNNEPSGFTNTCLPPPPNRWPFDYTIFAYWDDLRTDIGAGGIFTSVSGVMPNRVFNIEFRTAYVNNNSQVAQFEVRLFEGRAFFDVVYHVLEQGNASATAGVQRYDANFTQYFCEGSGNASFSGQRYTLSTTTDFNDFDHNGKPDYVLYNGGTRQTAVWYMNNNFFADGAFGPPLPAGWNVIDVADFNKDGDLDYALFNPGTRQTAIWYLSGVTLVESAFGPTLPSGWALVAVGDFIASDCSPDYVLYNASTRQTAVWRMDDNVFVGGAFGPTLPAGWSLAGVADFNGNGLLDYLLFNASTRQSAIWYLSGATFVSSAFGPTLPSGWALTGTADFSGGGKPDYLLYNSSTRQTAIWYLSNNVLIGSAYGPTLPAGWNLVAP